MSSGPDKPPSRGELGLPERRSDFAKRKLVDAVSAARAENDPLSLARALIDLGRLERGKHRLDAARRSYEEAAAVYRRVNEALRLAHTVRHVGDILQDAGHLKPAEPRYVEALRIYRAHADTPPLDLANAIRGYALLQGEFGRKKEAIALWREARGLYAAVSVQAGVEDCDRQIARLSVVS
jgi:tetratricopeptide (TPR) repeat protein